MQKHFKTLLHNRWLYGGLLFLIGVVGSYYALREWHAPGFLQAVYGNELGGRYLQELEQNGQPPLYYFSNFTWRYPYWLYLLVPAFIVGFLAPSGKAKVFSQFTFVLSITYLLIISSSKTKLYWYDVPIYPLLALQVGWLLYYGWHGLQKQLLHTASEAVKAALAVTLFALVFVMPFRIIHQHIKQLDIYWNDSVQTNFLQQAIRQQKDLGNYTFYYEEYDRHIRYYIKRLQSQKVNVRLANDVYEIQPGTYVVTSHDSTRQKLLQHYEVSQPVSVYGCQVDYIKGKIKEQAHLLTSK